MFDQPVARGNRGEGLARAGGHLDQTPGTIVLSDFSIPVTAWIWLGRKPFGSSVGRCCNRARKVGASGRSSACCIQDRTVSGLAKVNTSRERGFGRGGW